jgi:DNA-binding response OmpR family regulator
VHVPAVPAPQRTRDRRIVLLDHEGDGRSFIAHALRDEGYAVYPVDTQAELLRVLEEHRYDAAIVDVDRLTVDDAVFAQTVGRLTTLVRIASNAPLELSDRVAVLRKPFLLKDLYAVVEAAVADRRRGPRRGSRRESDAI